MTFKQYITEDEKNIVSFDFDDTIALHQWDRENNDYARDEKGERIEILNPKIAAKIKDYKARGWTVFLVTTRLEKWRQETEDYLKKHELFEYFDGIYFTNLTWKAKTLKRLGVNVHYDDNIRELKLLRYKGIKGVLVNDVVPPVS